MALTLYLTYYFSTEKKRKYIFVILSIDNNTSMVQTCM